MNYKMMGRFMAQILAIEGVFMIPALIISLCDGAQGASLGFACAIVLDILISSILWLNCRSAPSAFYAREGLVCVGASWIVLSLIGCLPFWISREIPLYIDAFFEIVSGFTTTGSSILPNVEGLSRGLLYWRSFSHWLGGMGVLVFLLAFTGGKVRASPCTCSGQKAPAPTWASWFPKCATPHRSCICCTSS